MNTGAPRMAGVIGWPVEHSLSPRVHGYWLKKHNIAGDYVRLSAPPEDFETIVWKAAAEGFRGANVTVPHKEKAAALCARLDPAAEAMGAVNTLVFEPGGVIAGLNTDGYGFMQNLRAGAPGWSARRPAAVLGAGGAARAVCHALKDAGCGEIRIINRTLARAEALADSLGGGTVYAWEDRAAALKGAGLLVNTTTLGMTAAPALEPGLEPALEIDMSALPKDAVVTDIVYTPLETPLLAAAQRRGLTAVDGLGMLLHQAAPGFEAWFGVKPEVDEALRAHLMAAGG